MHFQYILLIKQTQNQHFEGCFFYWNVRSKSSLGSLIFVNWEFYHRVDVMLIVISKFSVQSSCLEHT